MRGEDYSRWQANAVVTGSPPHARGRPDLAHEFLVSLRITPACAGKTKTYKRSSNELSDHPRMRGEDGSSNGAPV